MEPLLATASLLPSYETAVFSEYIAFLPITALLLATLAPFTNGKKSWPALALVLIGLLLALGRFNLISYGYARLPGFDLFRVPARWLILYSLGISLLAGLGLQTLITAHKERKPAVERPLYSLLSTLPILTLLIWGYLALPLSRWLPLGAESPLAAPTTLTLLAIFTELILASILIYDLSRRCTTFPLPLFLFTLSLASLYFASRDLPYNNLTTAEAYHDQRPPSLRLAAETLGQPAPARFLSLSEIFFDPGDQAEIDTIYRDIPLDPSPIRLHDSDQNQRDHRPQLVDGLQPALTRRL